MAVGLGFRIYELLKASDYSQKELAQMVGVTEAAMSRYIKGEREPKMEILANIATALGTTTDYLISGKEDDISFDNIIRLVARSSSTLTNDEKMKILEVLANK